MNIGKFELIDHGIKCSQYFQGCGVAFTDFGDIVTGVGDNPAEAIIECLEQMAMSGFDVEDMEARIMTQEGWGALPLAPNAYERHGSDSQLHYHVSIRWDKGA